MQIDDHKAESWIAKKWWGKAISKKEAKPKKETKE